MDQVHHETELVKAFIRRDKHDRFLSFLPHTKKRRKATDMLYHLRDLDEQQIVQIELNGLSADQIARQLRNRGASKTCWVISTNSKLDAKELDLQAVLEEIVGGSDGSLLSCVPGELAYYEGESPNNRCILQSAAG